MTGTKTNATVGDRMKDGTLLAGISPDTGKPIYTTAADAKLTYTFNGAGDYVATLNRERYLGHDDWRMPTKGELNVLFNNRAAIGGFDLSGSNPAGWYWSSAEGYNGAWAQRFSDGTRFWGLKYYESSLRCVR